MEESEIQGIVEKEVSFTWSETFISLEGEFMFCGYPTVYVRFSKCNFTCQGFNNPDNAPLTNDVLGFDPIKYKSLSEIPLITKGCDSLYAHDARFSHLWHKGNADVLANELVSLLPDKQWHHPKTEFPYILSLTGGEPMLYQKTIPSLLDHPLMEDLSMILIETNCSVPLLPAFIDYLNEWKERKGGRQIIWSNSPKLSASGEPWNKAIKPMVARQQLEVRDCIQYFKFVVGPRDRDFDEVSTAMNEYFGAGISRRALVGIMPESCTQSQQDAIAVEVADMCIKRGYVYVCRLQSIIWGNTVGT